MSTESQPGSGISFFGAFERVEPKPPPPDGLKFTVTTYSGFELLDIDNNPVKDKDAFTKDMRIFAGEFFPAELDNASFREWEPGKFHVKSKSGRIGYSLQFDIDDRRCWVCTGVGNLAGLARLKFTE